MSDADSKKWASKDLRDALEKGELTALRDSGLVSGKDLDYLLSYARSYSGGGSPEDADEYEELAFQAISRGVSRSVESGNVSHMSHATGSRDTRVDMSSWQAIDELIDLWQPSDRHTMLNLMLYAPLPPEGPTGVGKTDFAYTVIEAGQRAYPTLSVASNNLSDPFDNVESWSGLADWLSSVDGPKCMLLDEAAQVLQFADMSAGKALSKLIKLLRKHNCHLIVISHTGKDIPKDIRRMVLVCRKDSKKKCTIGRGLEERGDGDMQVRDALLRLKSIPETRIQYDTLDTGDFEFDMGDDDRDDEQEEEVAQNCSEDGCKASSKQYPEIAETGYCPYHQDD